MKKSFSLMEVIIAVVMLSVVMVALLQVKTDNIFILSKLEEKSSLVNYIGLGTNLNVASERNENLFLDRLYSFDNDELRRDVKDIKIKIKDKEIESKSYELPSVNFDVTTYVSEYSIKDDIKKSIYTFKIGL